MIRYLLSFLSVCLSGLAAVVTAPSNLHSVQNEGVGYTSPLTIFLRWDEADPRYQYEVERSTDGGLNFSLLDTTTVGVTADNVQVPQDSVYQYRVRSKYSGEFSDYSNVKIVVGCNWPDTVSAQSTNATEVKFVIASPAGSPAVPNVLNQSIIWSTNADWGSPSEITIASNATAYTHTMSFESDTVYYYKVVGRCAGGDSEVNERSGWLSLAPNKSPPAPDTFRAYTINESDNGVTPTTIRYSFTDRSLTEMGFLVEYSVNGSTYSNLTTIARNPVLGDKYDFQHLAAGSNYWLRLSATNSVGSSAYATNFVGLPSDPGTGHTNWYVDAGVVGGDNTGTSWANAWKSPNSINWVKITGGHTVYVSGGTYQEGVYCQRSGSTGSPIVFSSSTDSGHNDRIVMQGGLSGESGSHDLWFLGGKDNDIAPTNITRFSLTNNINWQVSDFAGYGFYASNPEGLKLKWIEFGNLGTTTVITNFGEKIYPDLDHGVVFANDDYLASAEIAYCWLHDITSYHLHTAKGGASLGAFRVHHNIMERHHGEVAEGLAPVTFFNNIIGPLATPGTAHADGIHLGGATNQIYNNIFFDLVGQIIYLNLNGTTPCTETYVYNNVIYNKNQHFDSGGAIYASFSEQSGATYWNDVVVANNTIYQVTGEGISFDTLSYVVYATNWIVANNVVVSRPEDSTSTSGIKMGGNLQATPSELCVDFNLVVAPSKKITFLGTTYADGAAVAAATQWDHNSDSAPVFADAYSGNLSLSIADTAARGAGTNLAYLESACPGISADITGKSRGSSWDIGAYQGLSVDTNLMLWFTFEPTNWTSTHIVIDQSGHTNNGLSIQGNGVYTNWPSLTNGVFNGYGAHWRAQDPMDGYSAGDYISVTNWQGMNPITNGTVSVWAWCNTNANTTTALVDAGYSGDPTNSWRLARDYGYPFVFKVFLTGSVETNMIEFPDDHVPDTAATTNWHHYAVTWNTTNVVGYYDGVAFQTNTMPVTPLIIHSYWGWLSIGAWHHDNFYSMGNPANCPNNGWHGGEMDDVRIYNRNLQADEVYALYSNSSGGGVAGGGEPEPPSPTGQMHVSGTVRANQVRQP